MNNRLRRLLFACLAAWIASACGPPELEYSGKLDRTVGEIVTAELMSGENNLSGDAEIRDAAGASFAAKALDVKIPDENLVQIKVPTGIAVGRAWLDLGQKDSSDRYLLPLQISRLAVTMSSEGKLETLPLPNSTVSSAEFQIGAGKIALSPDGGLVLVLADNKLHSYRLGQTPTLASEPLDVPGATAVAATNDSAIVGTKDKVFVYQMTNNKFLGVGEFKVTEPQHIAVASTGNRAVVLSKCDTVEEDCLNVFEIGGSAIRQLPLENKPSAGFVAIKADGQAAVVVDEEAIRSVLLDDLKMDVIIKNDDRLWPSASQPTGITRTSITINNDGEEPYEGTVFAISNTKNNSIGLVGLDTNNNLGMIEGNSLISLSDLSPTGLSFGRDGTGNLYVASSNQVYKVNIITNKITPLDLKATGEIVGFVVQP